MRRYDGEERLTENYLINSKGDTLISEQYEWNKGRLVRMVENGMARIYIYGKNPTDTVRVVPSDEGVRFHSGYNGTAGKIPSEADAMYEDFTRDPYGYIYHEPEKQVDVYSSSGISVLLKLPAVPNPEYFCPEIRGKYGMPPVECIRYKREHVLQKAQRGYPYPNKKDILLYGEAGAKPNDIINCECIDGKYHIKHKDTTANEYIQVTKSGWRYNKAINDWEEWCWSKNEMQSTYNHEVMHIENAKKKVKKLHEEHFKEKIFDTRYECELNDLKQFKILEFHWDQWYGVEQEHATDEWKGINHGNFRAGSKDTCLNRLN
jgi:hypothetical protein